MQKHPHGVLLGILFIISFIFQINFAGFIPGTLVKVTDGYKPIELLIPGDAVYSIDDQNNIQTSYIQETFSYSSATTITTHLPNATITTSPFQQYYLAHTNSWQAARHLTTDNTVLSISHTPITIETITTHNNDKTTLYDIQLEDTHTFCVTEQDIIVHNFPPIFVGVAFAFGGGITLEGIKAGVCIAGIWIGTKLLNKNNKSSDSNFELQVTTCDTLYDDQTKDICYNAQNNDVIPTHKDAQAPGKPTENDGFIPKKNWDGKKIKHRRGHGWPDKKGSIWIPTGPNGHGGPHWDVQHPDGTYDNVVPGGRIRGQK